MSDPRALVLTADGLGGSLLATQCASLIRETGKHVYLGYFSRDETYKPFKFLFDDLYYTFQLPAEDEQKALNDDKYIEDLARKYGVDEIYFTFPDDLFRGRHSFDWKKYKTPLNVLKQIRTLRHKYHPEYGNVYVNLFSSTPGYLYKDVIGLLLALCEKLPNYKIRAPFLNEWNGIKVDLGRLPAELPKNLYIYYNPDIIEQINICRTCEYSIVGDNGFSHLSFHFGQNYLLLDPRINQLPWMARWRQIGMENSSPIDLPVSIVAKVVFDNLTIPQSNLLPKYMCQHIQDYSKELLFKY